MRKKITERERLIKLIREAMKNHEITIENYVIPTPDYISDYLLKNGVVVLPCKVGTPLYFLSGDLEKCKIIESSSWLYIVDSLGLITIEETLYELCYKYDYDYVFGVTVFSTYEEAEKALHKINHNSLCETETYKIKQ